MNEIIPPISSSLPVYAFIDSQNVNLGVQAAGWKLDFIKFRTFLREKYQVEKAFLFIGFVSDNVPLYTKLQKAGYIIVFKPTLEFKKEGVMVTKGNVDGELILHAMIEFPHYSKAVIASGDGDFHCLLEYLEEQGKLQHLIIPNPQKFSALLRRFRNFMLFLRKDHFEKRIGRNVRP